MCRVCVVVAFAAAGALAGCDGDGPLPPNTGPSLQIIAGANLTDTISTIPSQGLVVQVRGEDGRTTRGVEVRFEALISSGMEVGSVGEPNYSVVVAATTDGNGRAVVRTRMRTRAGPAWIAVEVPLIAMEDTARYTVLPGAATSLQLLPRDTTLSVGASFSARGSTRDRGGNVRSDPITYEGSGGVVTVVASGNVTGAGIGSARVRGRSVVAGVTLLDSVRVAVVPHVRIATTANTGLAPLRISDLSGANQIVVDERGLAASWEPGNTRLVYERTGALVIATVGGSPGVLPTPGVVFPTWPEWSSDGQWIYFHATGPSDVHVFRIRPNGTDLTNLTPGRRAEMPSASPDGQRIVYVATTGIVVQDLATGATQGFANTMFARAPRWSPDGQWIAYTRSGQLILVRPDGSDVRTIAVEGIVGAGLTWSPDSRWIVASTGRLQLVDAASGGSLPLSWFGDYPAWPR